MTFQLRFEATKILKANVNEKSQNFTSRLFFYEIDLKACENTKSHLIINVAPLTASVKSLKKDYQRCNSSGT